MLLSYFCNPLATFMMLPFAHMLLHNCSVMRYHIFMFSVPKGHVVSEINISEDICRTTRHTRNDP